MKPSFSSGCHWWKFGNCLSWNYLVSSIKIDIFFKIGLTFGTFTCFLNIHVRVHRKCQEIIRTIYFSCQFYLEEMFSYAMIYMCAYLNKSTWYCDILNGGKFIDSNFVLILLSWCQNILTSFLGENENCFGRQKNQTS